MRIAICDDEERELAHLSELITKYQQERGMFVHGKRLESTVFCNSVELLSEIEKGVRFDVLFLDVMMPGENGIHVAKEIRKHDNNMKIIFLTSSAEFAVQSYTVGAYFYQMKPIGEESCCKSMDTVLEDCEREQAVSLIIRSKSGIARIDLNKLEYCEVIGRTLLFHMENGEILESIGSMDKLYGELTQYKNFLRPHRSFLVNMEYIQNISSRTIIMNCQAEIPVPHGKYSEIKNLYLEYAFDRKQIFLL